jgi:signal transduction histidine kinase
VVAALVLAGLTAFVVLVYVVIVLGGGVLLGHTSSPLAGLSVLATAVVALGFDPVQSRLEGAASRLVHGGQPSPYDVLRRFTEAVTGRYAAEELPDRVAQVLCEGTGAQWSQVWLVVDDRPVLTATWPPGATRERQVEEDDPGEVDAPRRRALPVRHGAETLGVLVVQERPQAPLTSVELRQFSELAAQAGLVLRGARLRAELERRLGELSARAAELRRSLERLVDVQDDKRRRLERDIHDGAQQHLVALAVNLRLAQELAVRSPDRAAQILAAQGAATADAIAALAQLSRGIYPSLLADEGLAAALHAATGISTIPVDIAATGRGRYAANLEVAAYFCALEALQNAAKHSGASSIRVVLSSGPRCLTVTVDDDGTGFDPSAPAGTGLANMRDRIESVGGVLTTSSSADGTRVRARIPAGRA